VHDTGTFGGLIALQNLLNESSTPPGLVSMSYGKCEAGNGASSNAAFNSTFQQAVTEGVSVFVSAGDHAAATLRRDDEDAIYGIGITGWGSSPYNVSVGGTDFGDTFAGTNSTYWSATNSKTYESAKSYVPEIPWNDSCASLLLAEFEGFSQTYGSSGFCNSSKGEADFLDTVGGGGGPSGCATGTPSNLALSAERAPVGQSRRISRCSEIRATVCAIFPMCRSLPPADFGCTIIHTASPDPEAFPVPSHPLTGREQEAHRSPHRSWLAFKLW
jgi:hypothetical protein